MKKYAIVLAALIGAASAQAQARTDGQAPMYVTVAGGVSQLNVDCTGTTSCDDSGSGVKLVAGYNFGNGFSVEAGYIGFGKFRAADSGVAVTVKPAAFVLGGAMALPLGTDWGMNFRLGVAQVKTKIDAVVGTLSGSDSESKAKVYAGLGVTYALSKTVKLELGIDSTQS